MIFLTDLSALKGEKSLGGLVTLFYPLEMLLMNRLLPLMVMIFTDENHLKL